MKYPNYFVLFSGFLLSPENTTLPLPPNPNQPNIKLSTLNIELQHE